MFFITNSPDVGQGYCFYKRDIRLQDAEISLAIVAPIVCALIGAIITKFMFKKHFAKAGIV